MKLDEKTLAFIAELRGLIRGTTPGPWCYQSPGRVMRPHPDGEYTVCETYDADYDARYIAACSPDRIKAILDLIDTLVKEPDHQFAMRALARLQRRDDV